MADGKIAGAHEEFADDLGSHEAEGLFEHRHPLVQRSAGLSVQPGRERAVFPADLPDDPRVVDRRVDLEPVPNDARVPEQARAVLVAIGRDTVHVEPVEGLPQRLSFLQHRQPTQPRLVDLQYEPLEQIVVASQGQTVLVVMIGGKQRVLQRPGATPALAGPIDEFTRPVRVDVRPGDPRLGQVARAVHQGDLRIGGRDDEPGDGGVRERMDPVVSHARGAQDHADEEPHERPVRNQDDTFPGQGELVVDPPGYPLRPRLGRSVVLPGPAFPPSLLVELIAQQDPRESMLDLRPFHAGPSLVVRVARAGLDPALFVEVDPRLRGLPRLADVGGDGLQGAEEGTDEDAGGADVADPVYEVFGLPVSERGQGGIVGALFLGPGVVLGFRVADDVKFHWTGRSFSSPADGLV